MSGTDAADRYLELVKRAVSGLLHERSYALRAWEFEGLRRRVAGRVAARVASLAGRAAGLELVVVRPFDPATEAGPWPVVAETMIGPRRLDHLQRCVETILADRVAGDLIEAGCWRGGAGILMRAALEARGDRTRRVWLADSFAGLPASRHGDERKLRLDGYAELAVPQEEVERAFERYGLLDERVVFLSGWFADTLPALEGEIWALIRLDGDLYDSTRDALAALYPRLSAGGFAVVDDYGALPGCRRAVDEFRATHGVTAPLEWIDGSAVCWRKAA
jgi:O-methyltransferase